MFDIGIIKKNVCDFSKSIDRDFSKSINRDFSKSINREFFETHDRSNTTIRTGREPSPQPAHSHAAA